MNKSKDTRVEIIECACGCGETLNKYDGNYRTRKYISGHNNRKYEDPLEYKRVYREKNKEEINKRGYKHKRNYYQQKRNKILERLGNECFNCGLKHNGENTAVFDFHHIDPGTKDFNLSSNGLDSNSIERVFEEADKCVILCANCHRLHHYTDQIPITKEIVNERNNDERGLESETECDKDSIQNICRRSRRQYSRTVC